jgi:hypothetical protein
MAHYRAGQTPKGAKSGAPPPLDQVALAFFERQLKGAPVAAR